MRSHRTKLSLDAWVATWTTDCGWLTVYSQRSAHYAADRRALLP